MTQISELMNTSPKLAQKDQTIQQAAQLMRDHDLGFLPVAEGDRLVGMITDRDITIRAIADGRGADTPLEAVMTQEVLYVYDDEEAEDVADNMGENKVRRLPVLNREKRLVGVISLSDLVQEDLEMGGEALNTIVQTGGPHTTTATS